MKTLITSDLIVAAGAANAHSFDDQRAVGSTELDSTLATDGIVGVDASSSYFAYQVGSGSGDLFAFTSGSENPISTVVGERTAFENLVTVGGSELDPSIS